MKPWTLATALLLLIVLFVPVLRDRVNAYFVVEASDAVTVHAPVNGRVDAVYVREGDAVRRGQLLMQMSSVDVAGMTSSSQAAIGSAHYHSVEAQLGGRSIGASAAEETGARRSAELAEEAQTALMVRAPVDGRVVTPQPSGLAYQQVGSGQALLTIAGNDPGQASERLRLYIPAGEMNRIQPGDEVSISLPGEFSILRLRLASIDGESSTLPEGIVVHQDYKGIVLPTFYSARLELEQGSPRLALGSVGSAKVFGARRSLAARAGVIVMDLVRAHIW